MNPTRHQIESYFFGTPRQIAERILFIKREPRLEAYKAHLTDVQDFGNVWRGVTGRLHGDPLTIIVTGVGPGLVGDAVYALDRPQARCLYAGTCGGLSDDLDIGDYFLADEAVCADGFSFHLGYPPLSTVAGNLPLLDGLAVQFVRSELPWARGLSFTTATVVRETEEDFWQRVHPRCRVIEMGAAAYYAAALASGKQAAAYFWVTDLPRRGKSYFDALSQENVERQQQRYEAAVPLDLALLASLP